MRAKPLIILSTIIFLGLVHIELEAQDSKSVASSPPSSAAELNGNTEKKNPLIQQANGFARGTRKWQTYASAAASDQGKGEMYALHLGYGYFLWDYLSVNVDVLGAYIRSGIDDNGIAAGLQQQSTEFSGSRHFNSRVMGGGGGFDGFMFYAGAMFPF